MLKDYSALNGLKKKISPEFFNDIISFIECNLSNVDVDGLLNIASTLVRKDLCSEAEIFLDIYTDIIDCYDFWYFRFNLENTKNNHIKAKHYLYKAILSSDKKNILVKRAIVKYINLLIFNLGEIDVAESFVNEICKSNRNDAWFLKLHGHLDKCKNNFSDKKKSLAKLEWIRNNFESFDSDTLGSNLDFLKSLIKRRDPIRIYANDILGVYEYLLLAVFSKNKSNSFMALKFDSFKAALEQISVVCLRYPINAEVPDNQDLKPYIGKLSQCFDDDICNTLLCSEAWGILSSFFISFGYFKAAFLTRENGIDSLILEKSLNLSNEKYYIKVILAMLERDDLNEAMNWIKDYENQFSKKIPSYLNNLFCIYSRDFSGFAVPSAHDFYHFRDFVIGKNVAIVGPSHSTEIQGNEIDAFDIVVRNNIVEDLELPSDVYGKKTNISYYADGISKKFSTNIKYISKNLDFLVFKSESSILNVDSINSKARVGLIPPVYAGAANQLPIMMLDLFTAQPNKLKIFYMDFHCSVKPYSESYKHTRFNFKTYVCHEPFSGLSLCRAIWRSKPSIKADLNCKRVFEMSNLEYSIEMERLHLR